VKTQIRTRIIAGNLAIALALITNDLVAADDKKSDSTIDPPLGVTGTVRKHNGFASKLVDPRNVHVWLPPSYEEQPARHYAVIYAMDVRINWIEALVHRRDWALDETMTRLIAEEKCASHHRRRWNTQASPGIRPAKPSLVGTPKVTRDALVNSALTRQRGLAAFGRVLGFYRN
jgi:hypothetical protein